MGQLSGKRVNQESPAIDSIPVSEAQLLPEICVKYSTRGWLKMLGFRDIVAGLNIVSISTASLLAGSTPALPQDPHLCTEVNYVAVACATIRWVSIEKGKPFVAERVAKSSDHSFHENDLVARDAAGRLYLEDHGSPWQFYGFTSRHDASTIWALGTVSILDCFGGKSVYLVPGSRTADVAQSCANVAPFQQNDHPYSYPLTSFVGVKTPFSVVEDLGTKAIEGFQAHGIKTTWVGTEKDGEWNRKPIRAVEEWRSDELGATMLVVNSDFRKATEYRSSLINIRRMEPEASLFEVPSNYKINKPL